MRLLLDTHIMLCLVAGRAGAYGHAIAAVIADPQNSLHVSVTSLWEMMIKWRLGKLSLRDPPSAHPALLVDLGIALLPLDARHVLAEHPPEPATRDPFDRILLSICAADGYQLVTADRALMPHPLAWRPQHLPDVQP